MSTVRTRIAPSPTGYLHIGTIYQAMFDYVVAKKYNGQFIVRIEDTDRKRFVEGAEDAIFRALKWFHLIPNEDPIQGGPFAPYRQSERLKIYKEHAQILLDKGNAYYCFCSPERLEQMRQEQQKKSQSAMYDRLCLSLTLEQIKENIQKGIPFVIRMKIPRDQIITVHDSLVGDVKFEGRLIDDQVLLKSDGFPTYHLAVVIDDHLMQISHVIRGREWLPSTPKHVLLYQFFSWEAPKFTHLPLFLKSEGEGKLSKRDNSTSVDFYMKEGFLPEAILNYLSDIVWNNPDGKEIYDLEELKKAVDIQSPKIINITSQAPKFDIQKLEWINGEHIRKMSDDELTKRLQEFLVDSPRYAGGVGHPAKEKIAPLVPLIKERIKKLSDFIPLTDFIFEKPEYEQEIFQKIDPNWKKILEQVLTKLESLPKPWKKEDFEATFQSLAKELSLSNTQMFQLIRVAISGQLVTPPLFESIQILGEDETIERVKTSLLN